MEEQTHRGEWWIPDSDTTVAGEMHYNPQEGVKLELFDSLGESLDPLSPLSADRIFGNVFEEGAVTLRNVFNTGAQVRGTSKIQQSISASTAFLGGNIGREWELTELELEFPYLSLLTSHNVIQNNLPKEDAPKFSTRLTGPESTEIDIDEAEITLSTIPTVDTDISSTKYSQSTKFILESSDPLSYREVRQYLNFLQRYVSLAYQDPVYPNTVTLNDDIELLYQIAQYHEPPEIRGPHNLAFRQPDIDIGESLNRWVAHSQDAETLHDMYFSIVYDPDMSVQYDFLSLSIAIESYFRYLYPDKQPMEKAEYSEFRESLIEEIPDHIPVKERVKNLLESIGNDYSFSTKVEDVAREYE